MKTLAATSARKVKPAMPGYGGHFCAVQEVRYVELGVLNGG